MTFGGLNPFLTQFSFIVGVNPATITNDPDSVDFTQFSCLEIGRIGYGFPVHLRISVANTGLDSASPIFSLWAADNGSFTGEVAVLANPAQTAPWILTPSPGLADADVVNTDQCGAYTGPTSFVNGEYSHNAQTNGIPIGVDRHTEIQWSIVPRNLVFPSRWWFRMKGTGGILLDSYVEHAIIDVIGDHYVMIQSSAGGVQ